jgi:hypothetical protein
VHLHRWLHVRRELHMHHRSALQRRLQLCHRLLRIIHLRNRQLWMPCPGTGSRLRQMWRRLRELGSLSPHPRAGPRPRPLLPVLYPAHGLRSLHHIPPCHFPEPWRTPEWLWHSMAPH